MIALDPDRPHAEDSYNLRLLGKIMVGVAHDLNNFLTIILGSLEPLTLQPNDGAAQERLKRAGWATKQAAALVSQLISFGRGQPGIAGFTDLASLIPELLSVLPPAISLARPAPLPLSP